MDLWIVLNVLPAAGGSPYETFAVAIETAADVNSLTAGGTVKISFVPHLAPWNRGIHTTIFANPSSVDAAAQVAPAYEDAYADEPFVRVLSGSQLPDIKNVAETNFVDIAWRHDARTGALMIFCAEDNLTKGAAGQGVQCLNLIHGWPLGAGLIPGVF